MTLSLGRQHARRMDAQRNGITRKLSFWTSSSFTSPFSMSMNSDDLIKLFVGQVPREADENALRAMFSKYGQVQEVAIVRDRSSGASKGRACEAEWYPPSYDIPRSFFKVAAL